MTVDINRYVIRLNLMGSHPMRVQPKNDNSVLEFIQTMDDIEFKVPIGLDTNITYKAHKGDYLNITDPRNISPIKESDFEKCYIKLASTRPTPNFDDVDMDFC